MEDSVCIYRGSEAQCYGCFRVLLGLSKGQKPLALNRTSSPALPELRDSKRYIRYIPTLVNVALLYRVARNHSPPHVILVAFVGAELHPHATTPQKMSEAS